MKDAAMVAPYPDACMLETSLDVDLHRSTYAPLCRISCGTVLLRKILHSFEV